MGKQRHGGLSRHRRGVFRLPENVLSAAPAPAGPARSGPCLRCRKKRGQRAGQNSCGSRPAQAMLRLGKNGLPNSIRISCSRTAMCDVATFSGVLPTMRGRKSGENGWRSASKLRPCRHVDDTANRMCAFSGCLKKRSNSGTWLNICSRRKAWAEWSTPSKSRNISMVL